MNVDTIVQFDNKFDQIMQKDIDIVDAKAEKKFENILGENKTGENIDGIKNTLGQMSKTQQVAKSQLTEVLLGRADNAHEALINIEKAKLEMQFATAVREKAVTGINQLLNMQI